MGIFNGCLLACDVDGTILVNGYLPKRNIEAFEYFKSEGGLVSLSTGRNVAALKPVLDIYSGYAPSVVVNGAMIYDIENDELLYDQRLENNDVYIAKKVIDRFNDVGVEAHCGKNIYVINRTEETDIHERYEKLPSVFKNIDYAANAGVNKMLYLSDDEKREADACDFIFSMPNNCFFTYSAAIIEGKPKRYLEQLPKGTSKAKTLKILCEKLNIKKENLFCIGDYFNDLEMLKAAQISACPVESPEEIKKETDFVVGSAQNGAVADFIDILKGEILNGRK